MPAELTIRPTRNDHKVLSDLLAPGHAGSSPGEAPLISRIVLDAPTAASSPSYAEDAAAAGVPVVVDPLTWLFQGDVDPTSSWSRLPFAQQPGGLDDLQSPARRRQLIEAVVQFQLEQRSTSVVPPYFAASGLRDPWLDISLSFLTETAVYLRDNDIRMPLLPVFTGRLDRFARPAGIEALRGFSNLAADLGVQLVAAQLGPAGAPADNYAKVLGMFRVVQALRRPGVGVHVWRQGVYGPALVAAGAHGYDTGLGYGEKTDLAAAAARKRPPKPNTKASGGGGGGRPVFVRAFGRSVVPPAIRVLATNLAFRSALLCEPSCCPDGVESTLGQGREHTLRSRARQLHELDDMPSSRAWRLQQVAKDAQRAADLINAANPMLTAAGLTPLNARGQQSLADVTEFLRKAVAVAS